MLLCGPLSVRRQAALPDGAVSAIGADGELLTPAPHEAPARDEPARARG
jgi:hypothetical protein